MGGPMWWGRLMGRNALAQLGPKPYSDGYIEGIRARDERADGNLRAGYIAGELWRMHNDYLARVAGFAAVCGISREQADRAMRAFFSEPEPDCAECQRGVVNYESGMREGGSGWLPGRCGQHEFIWCASAVPAELEKPA